MLSITMEEAMGCDGHPLLVLKGCCSRCPRKPLRGCDSGSRPLRERRPRGRTGRGQRARPSRQAAIAPVPKPPGSFLAAAVCCCVLSFTPLILFVAFLLMEPMPEDATLPRVHQCLRGILRVTPLAVSNLFHAVKEHLPHRRRDLYLHVGFYHELLSMLDYCYPLRARVLHLLVERLVDLDVQIARQEQALEEAAENDETIFEVESETSAEELKKMRQNAEKLDTLLAMLMEAVRATCSATADDAVTTTTAASTSTAAHAAVDRNSHLQQAQARAPHAR